MPISPDLAAKLAVARGAVQHPGELAELVRFLQGRPPARTVLEIGVHLGGTLWLWRRICDPHGRVLGVDLAEPACPDCDHRRAHVACPRRTLRSNLCDFGHGEAEATILHADSRIRATCEQVRAYFPAGVDLVHIDGDHGPGVWADFQLYSELVADQGVLILHDVTLETADKWPPAAVWEGLRGAPGAFEISHPGGFGFGVFVGHEWRTWMNDG